MRPSFHRIIIRSSIPKPKPQLAFHHSIHPSTTPISKPLSQSLSSQLTRTNPTFVSLKSFHTTSLLKMSAKEPHETTEGSSVPPPQDANAKKEDWKNLVPYKVQQKDNFKAVLDASCHCGRVRYQLSKNKPLDAKYCHCRTCQKLHGMSFCFLSIAFLLDDWKLL